jgi:Fe-S cluster assembly iron-binding protein IscA
MSDAATRATIGSSSGRRSASLPPHPDRRAAEEAVTARSALPTVGMASPVARALQGEELAMLTITDNAVSAIRSLTSQPDLPVDTGLRIMKQGAGAPAFQLALTEGPAAGDQVVEEGGARLFVEPAAAAALEDKALDAQVNEQGDLAFHISDQAPPA